MSAEFDLLPPTEDQLRELASHLDDEEREVLRSRYQLRHEPLPDKLGRGAPEGLAWMAEDLSVR